MIRNRLLLLTVLTVCLVIAFGIFAISQKEPEVNPSWIFLTNHKKVNTKVYQQGEEKYVVDIPEDYYLGMLAEMPDNTYLVVLIRPTMALRTPSIMSVLVGYPNQSLRSLPLVKDLSSSQELRLQTDAGTLRVGRRENSGEFNGFINSASQEIRAKKILCQGDCKTFVR